MQTLKANPDSSTGFLRQLVRKWLPIRLRSAFYHGRNAISSRGVTRSMHLAELFCYLGWREHKVTLPSGISLTVDISDTGVGFPLWAHQKYETEETELLQRILQPSNVFVDIGANLGYYTTLAAKQVGNNGHVIAFEPSPYNYSLLERNVLANNFTNVKLFNMALGNQSGTAVLRLSQDNYGDNRITTIASEAAAATVQVRIGALDEVLKSLGIDRVDCIKMDVQGFEGQVCEGMVETLAQGDLTVLTEFWPNGIRASGKDPSGLLKLFNDLGYSVHMIVGGRLEKVAYDRILDLVPKTGTAETEYLNLAICR